ncbi:MAG: DUF3084 domain-containing protein [Candidatus Eremiobacteraeota bacterium]|nr:DUF3084 domain-containing protein [Candidatus Eremiobacteraeota bacterium]
MVRLIITMIIAGILGGAIAYLGNQLGRYIGRKKLSIFRLRPRHTSILITTITGTLIAAGTLLFAYLSSWEVRTLFAGLQKFKTEVATQTIRTIEQADVSGVVYKEREPILTAVVDGTKGYEAVTEQISEVLGYANEAALQKSKEVADLMGADFTLPRDGKLVGYIPEELNNLATFIDKKKNKVIVMVFPLGYAFLGDKFAVGFYPIDYKPNVFSQDQEITSASINGTSNKGELFTSLAKLIVKAKGEAIRKGMIENPKTYQLIELDRDYFLQTIDKIGAMKKTVTVVVKAKKSVDNRGPLEVYLELK